MTPPDVPAGAGIILDQRYEPIPAACEREAVLHGVPRTQFTLQLAAQHEAAPVEVGHVDASVTRAATS